MLSELLKFSLIETKAVGTAAKALSVIQTEHFDLYLLDACLPDLDGVELCRRVRVLDPHTPVLFYSGAAYDDDKKRAFEAGANAYVIKPDVDGLLRTIRELLSRSVAAASGLGFSQAKQNQQCLASEY